MPTDDFTGRVARHVLGPGIPAPDVAGRIEDDDAVVGGRFDQHPIMLGRRVLERGRPWEV
jgi:hypothetical protein